jgi:septal ring factor EnvC (AmiA/AmiB activator)
MRLLPLLACCIALGAPGLAQDPAEDPTEPTPTIEDALQLEAEAEAARTDAARLGEEAVARAAEIERLQAALVAAAQAHGESEREALAAGTRLAVLETQKAPLAAQAERDREALGDVLAALVRLERGRPPAALVSGRDALDAARAASLLAETAPALETRAREALDRLAALETLETRIDAEQVVFTDAEATLAERRAEIAGLIGARTRELDRLRSDSAGRAQDAETLAERAAGLRELIAALESRTGSYAPASRPERAAAIPLPRLKPRGAAVGAAPPPFVPPTGRFADARGTLAPPAAGAVVGRYGERREAQALEGMLIRTRQGALVTSPFDARIEYAGAFRAYGRLLILSVGDDYHLVIAGLSSTYGTAGQTVLAGEPIGEMAGTSNPAPELYVEIRKDGRPIDPSPWWRSPN